MSREKNFRMPEPGQTSTEPVDIPEQSTYTIIRLGQEDMTVLAHASEVREGTLFLLRAIYGDEACTKSRMIAAHVSAAGTWSDCHTSESGYRKSPLAI